ncbi:MAG: Uma2 family endonuclease [Acidimicrobiales bacterium]
MPSAVAGAVNGTASYAAGNSELGGPAAGCGFTIQGQVAVGKQLGTKARTRRRPWVSANGESVESVGVSGVAGGNLYLVAIKAPGAVALSYQDLQSFPDDGYRRELVHGQLLVTPSPAGRHQRALMSLAYLLKAACPPDLEVLPAPYDWKLALDTVFQPDLMVIRAEDFDPDGPLDDATPLLVVEVLSPSSRTTDLTLKRYEYERAGVPAYWIMDPDAPSLVVLRLEAGRYLEAGVVEGETAYEADWPYRLRVIASELVR